MAFANYGELKVEIIRLAIRDGDADFAAGIPAMIALAESMFNYGTLDRSQIRTQDMITTATITITDGVGDLPDDFLEPVLTESALGRGLAPSTRRWNDQNFYYPYPNPYNGQPNRVYIEGDKIRVTPTGAATIDLTYYAKIPALVADADTNWLLRKIPGAYLYGSMIFGASYMEDDQSIGRFGKFYDQIIGAYISADIRAKTANTAIYPQGVTP